MAPCVAGHYLHRERTHMALGGLRAGLACELYWRANGRTPADLADLVPRWLPAVPGDFYAPGQPLQYATGRIWSVGPDGKTEAAPTDAPWYRDQAHKDKKVDLPVFPLVAKAPEAAKPVQARPTPPPATTLEQIFGIGD
jgi:hypothetical protein